VTVLFHGMFHGAAQRTASPDGPGIGARTNAALFTTPAGAVVAHHGSGLRLP